MDGCGLPDSGGTRPSASDPVRCVCEAVEPRRLLAAAPACVAVDTTWGNGRLVTDLLPGPGSYDDADYCCTGRGGIAPTYGSSDVHVGEI